MNFNPELASKLSLAWYNVAGQLLTGISKMDLNKETDHLAKKLAKLVLMFRRGEAASRFDWWNGQSHESAFFQIYGYQDAQSLYHEVEKGVLKLNGKMLSEHDIWKRLAFGFLNMQTISSKKSSHLDGQGLEDEARKCLDKLIRFRAYQELMIPIANLYVDGQPVEIGRAKFEGVTRQEVQQWKEVSLVWPEGGPDIRCVSRVVTPGDEHKAFLNAFAYTNEALDILRAFCFPFGRHSDNWQVGILGKHHFQTATPIVQDDNHVILQLHGTADLELHDVIRSKLEPSVLERINALIQETDRTKLEEKLLRSIHWLSESTKPDTHDAKLVKISVALEALLGGEPSQKGNGYSTVRGITAMLSERAAFVGGRDTDERLRIDKAVHKYYGKRGGIVHGDVGDTSTDDIDEFGELIRHLIHALLQRFSEWGSSNRDVNDLEKWVKLQKYTLPR